MLQIHKDIWPGSTLTLRLDSKGVPSLSQVMMAGGYDWASQTRDVGLLSVTVTSSAEPSGPEPAMVGETWRGNINKYTLQ